MLAMGLIMVAFVATSAALPNASAPSPVRVPRVTGLTQRVAIARLKGLKLIPRPFWRPSRTVPRGVVFSQSPPAGTRMYPNALAFVLVGISTGRPFVRVPNVIGESVFTAVQRLADRGLQPVVTRRASSRPADTVISQRPAPGARVLQKTSVVIAVSGG